MNFEPSSVNALVRGASRKKKGIEIVLESVETEDYFMSVKLILKNKKQKAKELDQKFIVSFKPVDEFPIEVKKTDDGPMDTFTKGSKKSKKSKPAEKAPGKNENATGDPK